MYVILPAKENYTPPFFLPYSQGALYKELQVSHGRTVDSFQIQREGGSFGYFQIVTYPLFGNLRVQYIPYGPVMISEDPEIHQILRVFLKKYAAEKNAVFTRLDFFPKTKYQDLYSNVPAHLYNTPYHQPRGEWLMDITPDAEELLAAMHKKTRYNINKSIRNELETVFKHGPEIEAWAGTFISLNEQNTKDHDTTTHDPEYFKSLFAIASGDERNFIAITRKDGHVLAINIFIDLGAEMFCPFGASNDLGKKLGAYYHIKWHAILHMKERGVDKFNWGGVSVSDADTYLAGVTKFKTGFGGVERIHPPLLDIVHKKWWYRLYSLRKRIQSLKKNT